MYVIPLSIGTHLLPYTYVPNNIKQNFYINKGSIKRLHRNDIGTNTIKHAGTSHTKTV